MKNKMILKIYKIKLYYQDRIKIQDHLHQTNRIIN